MRFGEWDEFTRWGLVPKAMFYFNEMAPNVPHGQNVPGLAILPYLISSTRGVWVEGDVFWAYHLIILAIFLSIFPNIKFRHIPLAIFGLIVTLVTSVVFFNTFETIYSDSILSIIFAYALFLGASKSTGLMNILSFNMTIFFLVLSKEIAPYFALVSIFVYLTKLISQFSSHSLSGFRLRNLDKKFIVLSVLPIFTLLFTTFSWSYFYNHVVIGNAAVKISTDGYQNSKNQSLINAFFNSNDFSQRVIETFGNRIFNDPIGFVGFPISTLMWISILALLLLMLGASKNSIFDRKINYIYGLIMTLGALGYLFILLSVYLTIYSGSNSRSLTSFERYVTTYLSGILLYIVFIFISDSLKRIDSKPGNDKKDELKLITGSLIITILFFQSVIGFLSGYILNPGKSANQFRPNFENITQKINLANFGVEDNVMILAQHTQGYEFYVLRYELLPARIAREANNKQVPYSIGSPYGPADIWTDRNMTQERFENALMRTDYVLIYSLSESFINEFGSYFQDLNSLTEQGIYRVEITGEKITLVKHI